MAARMYAQLRNCSQEDQHFIWQQLHLLGCDELTPRAQLSLLALEAFMAEHEGDPSKGAYEAWSKLDAQRPSSKFIVNSFGGSWRQAMSAVGIKPSLDLKGRQLLAKGGKFTREECLAGIRLYAQESGRDSFTFPEFHAWAAGYMQRQERELDRVPRSRNIFRLRFGSWPNAVQEAGFRAAGPRGLTAYSGTRADYTREAMIKWIRLWAEQADGNKLLAEHWNEWAQQAEAELRADGKSTCVPRQDTISGEFGSFVDALREASVITQTEARMRSRYSATLPMTNEEMLAVLRTAISEQSMGCLGRKGYEQWREQTLAANPDLDPREIPSSSRLRTRFTSFPNAVAAARQSGPEEMAA